MTLDGHGFQEWRVSERLDDSRVTTRDRRCALVDPRAYADAGGRTETDLFGELPPVLLDPDILTEVWTRRARGIAAVFEAEWISVHVTAGPEPELPDDLEALGYVYGGSLPAEEMARYRAQREVFNDRTEKARIRPGGRRAPRRRRSGDRRYDPRQDRIRPDWMRGPGRNDAGPVAGRGGRRRYPLLHAGGTRGSTKRIRTPRRRPRVGPRGHRPMSRRKSTLRSQTPRGSTMPFMPCGPTWRLEGLSVPWPTIPGRRLQL